MQFKKRCVSVVDFTEELLGMMFGPFERAGFGHWELREEVSVHWTCQREGRACRLRRLTGSKGVTQTGFD